MCTRIIRWFHDPDAEPDFKQIVEKSLTLFGVFTGVTLSFYIKDFLFVQNPPAGQQLSLLEMFPFWSRAFITAAVIALLLRYIVGSAVHLNATYVPKVTLVGREKRVGRATTIEITENKKSNVKSLGWLFFDIVMLVLFGVLGVSIVYAEDLDAFMYRSLYFVSAGFLWGLIAVSCDREDCAIAKRWMAIDAVQMVFTGVLIWEPWWKGPTIDYGKTALLAIVYVCCLLADFAVVSRPRNP